MLLDDVDIAISWYLTAVIIVNYPILLVFNELIFI